MRPALSLALVALLLVPLSMGVAGDLQQQEPPINDSSDPPGDAAESEQTDEQGDGDVDQEQDEDQDDDEEPQKIVAEVDENLRIENYSYYPETQEMGVVLSRRGDGESRVTLTEVIDDSSGGSGQFGVERVVLDGEETVEVRVSAPKTRGTTGVMVVSEQSLSNGQGAYVQVGGWDGPIDGSSTWTDVRVAGVGGVSGSILALLLGTWVVVRKKSKESGSVDFNVD